jgi:glutamine amidotransferase
MKVSIIKYNAGNICSVVNAFKRIGIDPIVTDDKEIIKSSDRIVFPGQGEAGTTMSYLKDQKLDILIKDLKQPVLGICIGMQLMCKHSEEGNTDCLGIFDSEVIKFKPEDKSIKIPQMGWNTIEDTKSALFDGISKNGSAPNYVYFIHSYYVPVNPHSASITNYVHPYSSALHKGNFYATQFHPEKSGSVGELILKNFIEKCDRNK